MVKQNKYRNQKIAVGNDVFDSVKEYTRYRELVLLQRAGHITGLRRQVSFELIPAQREGGKIVERACNYAADFVYEENGKTVVEDTKGFRTKDYIIKRKLMLYVHGIRIKEV